VATFLQYPWKKENLKCEKPRSIIKFKKLSGLFPNYAFSINIIVADSEEGVCVDPGENGAILETGGPGPPERGKGQQLAPDSGGEGT
jgi:hypothetical protein